MDNSPRFGELQQIRSTTPLLVAPNLERQWRNLMARFTRKLKPRPLGATKKCSMQLFFLLDVPDYSEKIIINCSFPIQFLATNQLIS